MDKIICVGKNYLNHAKELGDAIPEEPLYFLKPQSTLFVTDYDGTDLKLVTTDEVHHELELVLKIGGEPGHWFFSHYTYGLDLTLRALQTRLKKAGQPWEKAKVFQNSAVLGSMFAVNSLDTVMKQPFELKVNGEVRQKGLATEMRWKPEELLTDLQKWFPLRAGDLLYTGTPEGVGPLKVGDKIEVEGGQVNFDLTCT